MIILPSVGGQFNQTSRHHACSSARTRSPLTQNSQCDDAVSWRQFSRSLPRPPHARLPTDFSHTHTHTHIYRQQKQHHMLHNWLCPPSPTTTRRRRMVNKHALRRLAPTRSFPRCVGRLLCRLCRGVRSVSLALASTLLGGLCVGQKVECVRVCVSVCVCTFVSVDAKGGGTTVQLLEHIEHTSALAWPPSVCSVCSCVCVLVCMCA